MEIEPKVSFEDTAAAFAYKSDAGLRKANFIFSLINHPWISFLATGMVRIALKIGLPVAAIIKRTAFDHFCGGESIEKSARVIQLLGKYNIGTILDYSVEGGSSEADYDANLAEILKTLEKAHYAPNIPFCVFKVTGLSSRELLQKINSRETLDEALTAAFERVRARVNTICETAFNYSVPVLIDAEETWIQEPIDALADEMMARYNRKKAIVYNTYQMYRIGAMDNLIHDYYDADNNQYYLGAKLVRGAYMEKERRYAERLGYPSPIQPDKNATDNAFNEALEFCLQRLDRISVMCGSHNEFSNALLARRMAERKLAKNDPRIWFAQLYGMSDNISFNLAKAGYNVVKYVPYGPVKAVMPYLFRRAAENTAVAGQSSRELTLIREEIKRRKIGAGGIAHWNP